MKSERVALIKHYLILLTIIVGTAIVLSFFAGLPYIYTCIGFSAWAFFGHILTIDDDMPGGWSNPDGTEPFPWVELLIKALIFGGLCAFATLCPSLRSFGS